MYALAGGFAANQLKPEFNRGVSMCERYDGLRQAGMTPSQSLHHAWGKGV